ncbi:MAG: aspartyl/asparaginyl beta-hydroxylase domain-containing protein [Pseudomonadota bacterium]
MSSQPLDLRDLARASMAALRAGDPARAAEGFQRIADLGGADASIWVALAMARRDLGEDAARIAAIDRALALDSRNMRARILKGDWFADQGDARAASSFYLSVVRAIPPETQLPADIVADVARARERSARYAADYEASLIENLKSRGFDPGRSSPRFGQAVDLLLGRRQVFFQQPRHFYFPELPQIQFYDRERFPWLDAVEAATPAIQAELAGVLRDHPVFTPYLQSQPDRPKDDAHVLLDNPDWGAFYLWREGAPVPENAARCPATLAALEDAPLDLIPGRAPSVLFSLLRPGAHIPPHHGFVNTRLICHLPLIVPEGCSFRVGNETRAWEVGKAWVFDDTIEHEAWNRSNETRVILLFEIWRPELSDEERALVTAMFEAIDAYGDAPGWEL